LRKRTAVFAAVLVAIAGIEAIPPGFVLGPVQRHAGDRVDVDQSASASFNGAIGNGGRSFFQASLL
jgi:hypothetical protein